MTMPLEGVRVVEVAQYVAGPLCGVLLAELGAEVIKVEPPAGDAYRQVMSVAPGLGRYFMPLNRGKRSVVLDLKTEAGRERLAGLVASADAVIHNSPPPRAQAFGLAWDALHAAHPALVVGVVTSASARTGPLSGLPAYDLVAQGRSGLLTAHASHGDRVPVRAGGIPMADLTAGHLLATGVLAALVRAKGGGEGCCVEVSLLGAALAVQIQDLVWLDGEAGAEAVAATEAGLVARAEEIADALALDPYYRCFGAADGYLAVACLNIPQRRAFLDVFELEDPTIAAPDIVPDDPAELAAKRVRDGGDRVAHRSGECRDVAGAPRCRGRPVWARSRAGKRPCRFAGAGERPRADRRAAGTRLRDDARSRLSGRRRRRCRHRPGARARSRHGRGSGGAGRMTFEVAPELELFAESVRRALAGWEAPLEPVFGAWQDDRDDALASRLAEVGWTELWSQPGLLAPGVAGGVELGRAVAPLSLVDEATLGTPLCLDGRVRHGVGQVEGGVREPTLDGTGTLRGIELPFRPDPERLRAWGAVTLAYLAGLADGAIVKAVDHARSRGAIRSAARARSPPSRPGSPTLH